MDSRCEYPYFWASPTGPISWRSSALLRVYPGSRLLTRLRGLCVCLTCGFPFGAVGNICVCVCISVWMHVVSLLEDCLKVEQLGHVVSLLFRYFSFLSAAFCQFDKQVFHVLCQFYP